MHTGYKEMLIDGWIDGEIAGCSVKYACEQRSKQRSNECHLATLPSTNFRYKVGLINDYLLSQLVTWLKI